MKIILNLFFIYLSLYDVYKMTTFYWKPYDAIPG